MSCDKSGFWTKGQRATRKICAAVWSFPHNVYTWVKEGSIFSLDAYLGWLGGKANCFWSKERTYWLKSCCATLYYVRPMTSLAFWKLNISEPFKGSKTPLGALLPLELWEKGESIISKNQHYQDGFANSGDCGKLKVTLPYWSLPNSFTMMHGIPEVPQNHELERANS